MITVNGHIGLDASLLLPRTGVWQADVRVDTADEITGPVTINVDEGRLVLRGTVARGGNWQDTGYLRVLGGAGGLLKEAPPKHYVATTMRIVLGDLLAGAGETLSPRTAKLPVSTFMWTTIGVPIGPLITRLLASAAPTHTWRVLTDGTVWVGDETWPDSKVKESDFQTLDEDPSRAVALLGVETPLLMPGVMLGDRRVSYVEHRLGGPQTRTRVWFE